MCIAGNSGLLYAQEVALHEHSNLQRATVHGKYCAILSITIRHQEITDNKSINTLT